MEQLLRSLTFLPLSEIQHVMRASETRHAQALLRIMNAVPIPHSVPDSNPDLAPSPKERQRQDKKLRTSLQKFHLWRRCNMISFFFLGKNITPFPRHGENIYRFKIKIVVGFTVPSVADPGCLSRIQGPNFSIPDPGSKRFRLPHLDPHQ